MDSISDSPRLSFLHHYPLSLGLSPDDRVRFGVGRQKILAGQQNAAEGGVGLAARPKCNHPAISTYPRRVFYAGYPRPSQNMVGS